MVLMQAHMPHVFMSVRERSPHEHVPTFSGSVSADTCCIENADGCSYD